MVTCRHPNVMLSYPCCLFKIVLQTFTGLNHETLILMFHYSSLQIIFYHEPVILWVRPGTRFDMTCSQFDWTKKSFNYLMKTMRLLYEYW